MKEDNRLDTINWNITNRCNLRCKQCLFSSGNPSSGELKTEEALRIIKEAADMKCSFIGFTGGEPLRRDDIFELLKFAKSLGIETGILTNGTLLNEKVISRLKNLGTDVKVSIDGMTEKINDMLRGEGSFRKAMRGIRLLIRHDMLSGIYFTYNKVNKNQLPILFDFVRKNNVKNLKIAPLILAGRAENSSELLNLKEDDVKDIFKKIKACAFGKRKDYISYINDFCTAGMNTCQISSTGKVFPCINSQLKNFEVGDLRKKSLKYVWNNSVRLKRIREMRMGGEIKCRFVMIHVEGVSILYESGYPCIASSFTR